MFLRNICEINFPWKLFYSAPNDLSSDFLDGSLMCPRGLGTDVLMMRVHWLDGWYRPLWSLRLCAVFIGQEHFPRAST